MFLFLSKLLPIFIYPLGLSCLLLLVALVLLWRRPRLATIPILLTLVVLLVASNAWVSEWLVRSLETQHIPQPELPKADAIVVLGGATRPKYPPRPWIDVMDEGDRVIHAVKLYKEGKASRIILSGGRIDWRGSGPPESSDMATLVEWMGVPKSAILEDPTSLNTHENAINVLKIMDAQGIRRILLVTSALHMPRSLRIFQKLGIDTVPAATDFWVSDRDREEFGSSAEAITLGLLPDVERLRSTTRALKEYMGLFVYWLRGWL
ncbi:MAG: YdcF family protein [Leptolyngbyaceae cyanobacterium RU_5_1]|nr:YdcF family protein [Leptolyngbyaceae cyanobacterium RU_5_1]